VLNNNPFLVEINKTPRLPSFCCAEAKVKKRFISSLLRDFVF